jgi:hypothetical protein
MDSSQNDLALWRPRWVHGDPYAAFVIATGPQGLWTKWWGHADEVQAALLRHFFALRLQRLPQIELDSEANFLCAAFRRAGRMDETIEEIATDTAIAEFGYGSPPASPEGWPLVDVRTLLEAAVEALSGSRNLDVP